MRRTTSDPKDFGRVGVLMGERCRFASTARWHRERPARDGRAGVRIKRMLLRQGRPAEAAQEAVHA
jgi:hypothetical protein